MGHIHTGPGEYDETGSAYIVRTDLDHKPKLMLGKHKIIPNVWMQFGGHKKETQDVWQAVIEETREETGYDIDQLKLLQRADRFRGETEGLLLPETVATVSHDFNGDPGHKHTDFAFAFVTNKAPRNDVAVGEIGVFGYFSLSELENLDEQAILPDVQRIGIYVLENCLTNWEQVDTKLFQRGE